MMNSSVQVFMTMQICMRTRDMFIMLHVQLQTNITPAAGCTNSQSAMSIMSFDAYRPNAYYILEPI